MLLKKIQSSYFIERLIEISEGDITALDFSGTQNNFNEIKILNNSKDNLSICKDYYNKIYNSIGHYFAEYLKTLPETLINEIEKDLRLSLYLFIVYKMKEVLKRFFMH